jgi:hypothetical protein
MFSTLHHPVLFLLSFLLSVPSPQSELDTLKSEYQTVTTRLEKHLVMDGRYIDDDPESPELLARHWSLLQQWTALWLNQNPSAGPQEIAKAVGSLSKIEAECLRLNSDAFLVSAENPLGNVFIIAKAEGRYRVAWSTDQDQPLSGKQGKLLAAWHARNAATGQKPEPAGPFIARLGNLPSDADGNARFYIDAIDSPDEGGTVRAQISLWLWNGRTALPQLVQEYALMIDQKVGTRLEGDLLKVQEKKFFRTFFSCGTCEERQTDWIVRVTPNGFQDLGEKSTVPGLDAIDELFYRIIHHLPTAGLATPAAASYARRMVREQRKESTPKEWKEFPSFGMMGEWASHQNRDGMVVCLSLDVGTNLFTMKPAGGKLSITGIQPAQQGCK